MPEIAVAEMITHFGVRTYNPCEPDQALQDAILHR